MQGKSKQQQKDEKILHTMNDMWTEEIMHIEKRVRQMYSE